MSYNLHITKGQEQGRDNTEGIRVEDWKRVVEADPEMKMERTLDITTPSGQNISIVNEAMAVWIPEEREDYKVPFTYSKGRISVTNPDDKDIEKMREIARKLGARVVGDEGEVY